MHRPLGRNLRIHKRFSARIEIRGFSPRTQFVGLRFSGCVLTTLRCILPTSKGRRGCNRTPEEIRTTGAQECIALCISN